MPSWQVPRAWRDAGPYRWRIEFDRIGRNHEVPPLDLPDARPDDIADAVYAYARQGLLSSGVEVTVDLDSREGHIYCGFQSGGSFKLTDHPEYVPAVAR